MSAARDLTIEAIAAHMLAVGYRLVLAPEGATYRYTLTHPDGTVDRIYVVSNLWVWWETRVRWWLQAWAELSAVTIRYQTASATERLSMQEWTIRGCDAKWQYSYMKIADAIGIYSTPNLPDDWMKQVESFAETSEWQLGLRESLRRHFSRIDAEEAKSTLAKVLPDVSHAAGRRATRL